MSAPTAGEVQAACEALASRDRALARAYEEVLAPHGITTAAKTEILNFQIFIAKIKERFSKKNLLF